MDAINEVDYKGYTIRIYPDDDSGESPREWSNLGHMALFHRRYNLGDEPKDRPDGCSDAHDFLDWMREHDNEIAIVLPVHAYEHSGMTIWTEDGEFHPMAYDPWDSGLLGYIYVLKSEIRDEYHLKRISKKAMQKAKNILISEVKTYDQYLTGDVYGYLIFADSDDTDTLDNLDSCWGFYGEKFCIEAAKEAVDYLIEQKEKAALHLLLAGMYQI